MDRRAVWFASTVALSLVSATQVPPTLTERYDLENRDLPESACPVAWTKRLDSRSPRMDAFSCTEMSGPSSTR